MRGFDSRAQALRRPSSVVLAGEAYVLLARNHNWTRVVEQEKYKAMVRASAVERSEHEIGI
jgi:hypothetical protein